ncbi:MAG TPA: carboxypeptidase-like regulatory domain-containing protein [Bryobacteraceae bacterium]|nr:carboxypeptidase-like regulatory domain-containing protein [Bryobacteraceae bacterium]
MLRRFVAMVFVLALTLPVFAQNHKKNQPNERSVSGVVTDNAGAPLKGAVVQLENTKTLQIRSFIAKDDGTYVFNGLSTDVDYQLSAAWNGNRSGIKTLSSFDSRTDAHLNLQIKTK